jgi:hypothetical protein
MTFMQTVRETCDSHCGLFFCECRRAVLTPLLVSSWQAQDLRVWKHNRFEAYKTNTADTASRSLLPGTNGATATMQMLNEINNDKQRVAHMCGQHCVKLWLEAAAVCGLTYECTATPGRRLPCRKLSDIGLSWKQDSEKLNCQRIAFIFDFYGTEVCRRAFTMTHQQTTCDTIMMALGVVMDVPPSSMLHGQKTCVQQQYSSTSNIKKNNVLRAGKNYHHVRVNREQGPARTNRNWKRPKHVFFTVRGDKRDPDVTVTMEQVSSTPSRIPQHYERPLTHFV